MVFPILERCEFCQKSGGAFWCEDLNRPILTVDGDQPYRPKDCRKIGETDASCTLLPEGERVVSQTEQEE